MVLNGCLSCLIHFQSELILKFRGYILVPSPLFHVFVAAYVFRKHSVLRWLSMIGAILWLHHTKNSRNLSTCKNLTFYFGLKELCNFTMSFLQLWISKKGHLLILLSRLAMYSQECKLKRLFEILHVIFEKISVFWFNWPKSWIWRTLGHISNIFCI